MFVTPTHLSESDSHAQAELSCDRVASVDSALTKVSIKAFDESLRDQKNLKSATESKNDEKVSLLSHEIASGPPECAQETSQSSCYSIFVDPGHENNNSMV